MPTYPPDDFGNGGTLDAGEDPAAGTREGGSHIEEADGADKITESAIDDLANVLGIPSSEIKVVSVEPVDWPDTSLGDPKLGELYAQVIIPGYRVMLSAEGGVYRYHTDQTRVVLVD